MTLQQRSATIGFPRLWRLASSARLLVSIASARPGLGHLAGSAADLAEDQAYLAEGMATVEKLRREYEPLITRGTDDERLMREFDQALIRVKQTGEQVIALVKSGGKPAEMVSLFRQEGRANFDLAVSKLAEDMAFNRAEGVKAANLGAATFEQARWSTIVAMAAVVALGLLAGFALITGVARPIRRITGIINRLAGGDKSVSVTDAGRKDEIGDLARSVEVFKTNMIEAERLAATQEAARAARSRRHDAMDHHTRAFGTSVTDVMAALGKASANMRRAAEVMNESAAAVHQEASETAGGADKSSADLTAVAAAVEQFTASVGEISRQVAVASEVATQAVQRAEASQATIRGLADSTVRIGDVVRLIDSIAGQTNRWHHIYEKHSKTND
jgi:methyl-accepting chemotaxis protein